jgi:serine protease Do
MSHQIVECPGCLTKLRVKESQAVIKLACPRCGEQLAVDPPEPVRPPQRPAVQAPAPQRPAVKSNAPQAKTPATPARPAAPAPAPRATRPVPAPAPVSKPAPPRSTAPSRPAGGSAGSRRPTQNQEDEWNSDGYDSYDNYGNPAPAGLSRPQQTFLQRYGLLIGIIGGGGGGLLVLIIGGFIYWKMQPTTDLNTATDNGVGVTPVAQETTPLSPPQVIADAGTPPAVIPQAVLPPSVQSPSPAASAPSTPSPNAGNTAVPGNVAVAALSADARKLRYEWKSGAEFVYQFTIQEGEGDGSSRTTGVCSYRVDGSPNKSTDDEESSGTGFVIAPNGIIATCAHVVEGAKRMEVNLGGQSYPATVIAVDAKADVALIQIKATSLPALQLGDSETVQLAESVRAIGYPLSDVLGTDVKVTTGTVAGIVQDKQRGKRIQIDASINPGNSGGPVVNSAGQVVGVASSKLSGSSVTSVGFASPINELRKLAATANMQFPVAAKSQELAGPEVARRVTPSVAYIRVWGNSGGKLYNVNYTASFSESRQSGGRRMGRGFAMPSMPSFPSHTSDNGKLVVNGLGEVVEYQGKEQLPAVLGPVGSFFLEPLDAHSESEWQTESETNLQRIKRDDNSPFGGPFGGRRGFGGPPGFPDPFGRNREDEVVETIPATERTSYRVENTLNNKISIAKSYKFTAVRSNGETYMNIRGNGTVVFDVERGMPSSMEFNTRIQQNDDGKSIDVPVKINYTLRSLEEIQREKEQAEAARKKQEEEKSTPNPELVDEVLAQIRAQEGGSGASQPIGRLAQLAVVDSKRDEVIRVMKNHMSNSNGFVKKSATEVFCLYATAEHLPELRKILEDKDGLMIEARKRAFQTIAKVGTAEDYPTLISPDQRWLPSY